MLLDEVNQYLVVKMEDCFVIPERFLKAISKPELNCMRPEYLCARRKQYNSHTRELFIQIGLRRDIESLKEKYSVVAI